jgi:hypothetical protein
VFAAGEKSSEDTQIGNGKQPAFRLLTGGFGGANNRAQMLAAGHAVKMVDADSGEPGDFFICKKLLTRFDGDHFIHHPYGLRDRLGFVNNFTQDTEFIIYRAIVIPFYVHRASIRAQFANASNQRL